MAWSWLNKTVLVDGHRCLVVDLSIGGDKLKVSRFGDLSGDWVGRWVEAADVELVEEQ